MKKTTTKSKKKSGFTLVEIMIVVVIIAVLASLAIPKYLDSRASSIRVTMEGNTRTVKGVYNILLTNPDTGGIEAVDTWLEIWDAVQGGSAGMVVAGHGIADLSIANPDPSTIVGEKTVKELAAILYGANYIPYPAP